MRIVHRYIEKGWYTPAAATALLIGTFPSILVREQFGRVRDTDIDFFYGSIDNNFWRDLSIIYRTPLSFVRSEEAVTQRMDLLDRLGLALSDCIYACETTGSAMDTALQNIEWNRSLITVLDQHRAINTLLFTSSSGKVNAESGSLKILREGGRLSGMRIIQKSGPRRRSFSFLQSDGRSRLLNTFTLISPSPLAEQWGGITPEKRRALYAACLPKLKA